MTGRDEANPQALTRRRLIKLVGASALVASCAPGTTPPPVATSAATAAASPTPVALRKVKAGTTASVGSLPIFVGIEEKYFAAEGIELEMVPFDSAALAIPPVSNDQIDVAQGASSAGLWNAVNRGIGIRVVADSAHSDPTPPGFPTFLFLVRKAHVDSGKIKGPADLKGLKFSMPAPGISAEVELAALLKQGGLTKADVQMVYLGFAESIAGLTSGAVDAGIFPEPLATQAVTQGTAVVLRRSDEVVPNGQTGVILYSPAFVKSELAVPFMVAWLRGVRLYNDAVKKKTPAARDKVFTAAIKYLPTKDRAIYEKISFQGIHPDGKLDIPSMDLQQDVFIAAGAQQGGKLDLTKVVDTSFATAAIAKLGGAYR